MYVNGIIVLHEKKMNFAKYYVNRHSQQCCPCSKNPYNLKYHRLISCMRLYHLIIFFFCLSFWQINKTIEILCGLCFINLLVWPNIHVIQSSDRSVSLFLLQLDWFLVLRHYFQCCLVKQKKKKKGDKLPLGYF